ncbi:hypothetical protein N7539_000559 [Penicillium diatomitis]|uniref:Uncharacterized protein n=1 Tax=Penicillium diatomitis TaxID=2819901 RepID=A0A9X0C2A7_9EURO|nr:uncharacterized protein N7539_000559 [Penicillium diatomitis]KAJ5495443.1 hypothetical protein N7539_000559 [Penicillium diatomitis]
MIDLRLFTSPNGAQIGGNVEPKWRLLLPLPSTPDPIDSSGAAWFTFSHSLIARVPSPCPEGHIHLLAWKSSRRLDSLASTSLAQRLPHGLTHRTSTAQLAAKQGNSATFRVSPSKAGQLGEPG